MNIITPSIQFELQHGEGCTRYTVHPPLLCNKDPQETVI